ncbi:MAG: M28 family peptidase [Candidatus Roizmanbacteria bacterium]
MNIKSLFFFLGLVATGVIVGYTSQWKLPSRLPHATESCSFRTQFGAYLLDSNGFTKVLYKSASDQGPPRDLMTGGIWGTYNNKQGSLDKGWRFETISERRTDTILLDGSGDNYFPGEKASVTLVGPELASDYSIKNYFCDDSSSSFKACPKDLADQRKTPGATISNFTIGCDTDINYGWILEKKTAGSPSPTPTSVPISSPTSSPTAIPPTTAPTSSPSATLAPTATIVPSPTTRPTQSQTIIDTIQKAINTVDLESIKNYIKNLSDDDTSSQIDVNQSRFTGSGGNTIERNYIKSQLQAFGLQVREQPFTFSTRSGRIYTTSNLIARLPGKVLDKSYVVSAHFDTLPTPNSPAPGSDDNGSGTASVIEIARVLSKYANKLNYSIDFILFSGEEQGLGGSEYYVRSLTSPSSSILGVLNMDMIGWNLPSQQNCVRFGYMGRSGANIMTEKAEDINLLYDIGLNMTSTNTGIVASDHASFNARGVPSALITECTIFDVGSGARDVCYHQSCDTPEKLDYNQITRVAKILVGTIISLGER